MSEFEQSFKEYIQELYHYVPQELPDIRTPKLVAILFISHQVEALIESMFALNGISRISMLILTRTIFETVVNCFWIATNKDNVAQRYVSYEAFDKFRNNLMYGYMDLEPTSANALAKAVNIYSQKSHAINMFLNRQESANVNRIIHELTANKQLSKKTTKDFYRQLKDTVGNKDKWYPDNKNLWSVSLEVEITLKKDFDKYQIEENTILHLFALMWRIISSYVHSSPVSMNDLLDIESNQFTRTKDRDTSFILTGIAPLTRILQASLFEIGLLSQEQNDKLLQNYSKVAEKLSLEYLNENDKN